MQATIQTTYLQTKNVEVLTDDDQKTLIVASYIHQYGVLFRLSLFAGLSMHELLGLQWSDIDPENKQIHLRYESFGNEANYNIHPISSPRSVTLPSRLFLELADLYEIQTDTLTKYHLDAQTNAVASTIKGYHMAPWLLEFFFSQLLDFCQLPAYPFSILRDTWIYQLQHGIGLPAPYADDSNSRPLFAYFYSKMKEVWY